ncbi:putative S-adenosyl-L-methionine-dependent methyltransferase [Helianthus annuus]|nr:putative S-adenosyl-L-methionine-dependent methyltransferase [Helianthus annuus]KAJ0535212.1 putative S-adenosyl-L-methionine-dependent methyltransferase [Helianthus annuus]KAJ0543090.1 putative S-adenosyl-L-methionine-dependent methyltransferase [Helianthus annuus]KAJ0708143.1 putative S-adenosyl-L-methionine-dependent methyltransferase [Helianthus annuus]KAJ0712101.1 putative S-adenosyl-L-methionine-dependent methyltransferase [Helianthus annuus]
MIKILLLQKLIKMNLQGWVILRDMTSLIETARTIAARLKWEARVVEIESNSDEKLLVCQKPLIKRRSYPS